MKTMNELKVKLQKATTLSEKIATRIEMIELNRLARIPDNSVISPIAGFLSNIYMERSFSHKSAFVLE